MVVWRENHYEEEQDRFSTEAMATDPKAALIRQRLEDMGLLKFLSLRYVRTQTAIL